MKFSLIRLDGYKKMSSQQTIHVNKLLGYFEYFIEKSTHLRIVCKNVSPALWTQSKRGYRAFDCKSALMSSTGLISIRLVVCVASVSNQVIGES